MTFASNRSVGCVRGRPGHGTQLASGRGQRGAPAIAEPASCRVTVAVTNRKIRPVENLACNSRVHR